MNRIMSRCSFPVASYAPSATSILSGVQVQVTKPAITMMAGMDAQVGAAGRVNVGAGAWCVGMVVASLGLGATLVVGML